MKFSERLLVELAPKHLLKHPFYEAWNAGCLSKETLRSYARQYFKHVDAFPRYVSAAHSACKDLESRQALLENLIDEERGPENHPELWARFSDGLGQSREALHADAALPQTSRLLDTFERLTRSSYPEAVGALFAYEHQVPEVAASKIDGLEKHYGISDERSLRFFKVHLAADVYHTEACARMLDKLSSQEQDVALSSAHEAADALWGFLDGMEAVRLAEAASARSLAH
jgi:pyrroloquinoline-quinone synthase